MKSYSLIALAASAFLGSAPQSAPAQDHPASFVYETPQEFFASGDFDGDGRTDVVIVDKASGKYRLGYQLTAGVFFLGDCPPSGIKDVDGFIVGKFLVAKRDGL